MELFKKPNLIRCGWLKMLWLSLIVLFSFPSVYADGSKDLYPSGVAGKRAYLRSSTNKPTNYPYPNLGVHYVYAEASEIITLASSAQASGMTNIRLYAPDGTAIPLGISGAAGSIVSRANELAGPKTSAADATSNTYLPVYHTASISGIYKVEFLARNGVTSDNDNGAPNVNANATGALNQPTSTLIAAWDISVLKGTTFQPGRVYATVFNMSVASGTPGFYGLMHVLTRDGYIYKVDNNGNNGQYFTFFVNNKGAKNSNDEPTYRSWANSPNGSNIGLPNGASIHSPVLEDTQTDITHKVFYTIPDQNLPVDAIGGINGSGSGNREWLRTIPLAPEASNIKIEGVDGTLGKFGTKGGYVTFNTLTAGVYTVEIESPTNAFPMVTLTGNAVVGLNKVYWNSTDGNGDPVPVGSVPVRIKVKLQGAEVHFPYIDMEINPNGIKLGLLDKDNLSSVKSWTVYWNDQPLGGSGTNNSHLNPPTSAGTSSQNGAHVWTSNYGDEKTMDTWTFIQGAEVIELSSVDIRVADLKISEISHNKGMTPVHVDDIVTYTVKVKNDGPSDVLGSPFTFTPPIGFVPEGAAVFAVSSCGEETTGREISYNTTTYKYESALNLPHGCEVTYTFTVKATNAMVSGSQSAEATILRPNDVTDPDATNDDPAVPPTDPYVECGTDGCNNILTTPIIVAPRSDLEVTKSINNNTPAIGDNVTFTVSVVNNGPDAAANVNVTDKLPSGYTYLSSTPSQGSYDPITGVWTIGNLSNGAPAVTLTVTGTVKPSSGTLNEYRNTATASSDMDDPDPSNNIGIAEPLIPSLQFSKEGELSTDGNTITYTFKVTNNGSVTMNNIALSEVAFSGTGTKPVPSFVSSTNSSAVGTLIPGEVATYSATYTLTQADKDAGLLSNDASVTGTPPGSTTNIPNVPSVDPTPKDPSDPTTVVDVPANPSLTFAKTGVLSADGNTVTYTFTVTNNGNVTMSGIAVSDPKITGAITLTTTTLAPGASTTGTATYTLTQAEKDAGEVVNKATVTGTPPTTDPSNPATPITPVPSSPDPSNPGEPGDPENPTVVDVPANPSLTLAKTGVLSADGNTVTYTFTVTNNGNVTMSGISVSDPKITGGITLLTTT
ncbi:conserved repeat domain-containing protein, partial [Sphingobacterium nematocida]